MKDSYCYIVGAGSYDGLISLPTKEDFVIAADGGFQYLTREGIMPNVVLGDFDSLSFVPEHENLLVFPPEKDDTDMAIAVSHGRKQGYKRFYLYGSLGGRLDHSLANIQLLTGIVQDGCEGYLIGENTIITVLSSNGDSKREIRFSKDFHGMISVFSLTDNSSGVNEWGLKYTLNDALMTNNRALGVSNEFCGMESGISVKNGSLLILWNSENGFPEIV